MTEDREKSLPVWAQQIIINLRNSLSISQDAVKALECTDNGSGIVVFSSGLTREISLPDRTEVSFGVGQNKISFSFVEGDVRAYSRGTLSVKPRAANSVYLRSY